MTEPSKRLAPRPPEARSRVSNHRDLLPNVDGRSIQARRYRDILASVCTDQGGIDRMSEVRLQLARRYAACCVLAEQMEADLVNGRQINLDEYSVLVSASVRVAQRIGVVRVPKDVTPDIKSYIEGRAG